MAQETAPLMTSLEGRPVRLIGRLPKIGTILRGIPLGTTNTLDDVTVDNFKGKVKILNIFPSIDTKVCACSVRKFNSEATRMKGVQVLAVSADLPFAQARFAGLEGIKNVEGISTFRSTFGNDVGVTIVEGSYRALLARSVIVLDSDNKVVYTQLVPALEQQPDYASVLAAVKTLPGVTIESEASSSAGEKASSSSGPDLLSEGGIRDFVKKEPVVIFSKTFCPYSARAKALVISVAKAPPVVIELDQTEDGDRILKILGSMTGAATTPRVFVGGKCLGGAEDIEKLNSQGKLAPLLRDSGV